MRRYPDRARTDGPCGTCLASSRGLDYHNNKINKLLYQHSLMEVTQWQVTDTTKMSIHQTQKFESGERDLGNMALRNAPVLAKVFDCDIGDLL